MFDVPYSFKELCLALSSISMYNSSSSWGDSHLTNDEHCRSCDSVQYKTLFSYSGCFSVFSLLGLSHTHKHYALYSTILKSPPFVGQLMSTKFCMQLLHGSQRTCTSIICKIPSVSILFQNSSHITFLQKCISVCSN